MTNILRMNVVHKLKITDDEGRITSGFILRVSDAQGRKWVFPKRHTSVFSVVLMIVGQKHSPAHPGMIVSAFKVS